MKTKMVKIKIITLASVAALALLSSVGSLADYSVYVNAKGETIELEKGSTYAIGASGTGLIDADDVYVLTASGLEKLSGSGAPGGKPNYTDADYKGGGGLLYDKGSVKIASDKVFVGLRYYYSPARDTGLEAANLENHVGGGYEFGYFDENREFVGVDYTDETKITMRIIPETSSDIGVYITGTEDLLFVCENTGSGNMLAVSPICESSDAVTWFAGNRYYGDFAYAMLGGGKITVVNAVDMEKYVMGVCSREMGSSWPLEALKAQAVAARTYAARNIKSSFYYSNCGFDVTGDTYSQAYSGCDAVGSKIERAAQETENQYLTWSGGLCDAQYFSSDGGATEDSKNVYGSSHPYLAGLIDPYESAVDSINRYSEWSYTMTSSELGKKVGLPDVTQVKAEYSGTGNVIKLTFISSSGKEAVISQSYCRTTLGLPSIRYSVEKNRSGDFVFTGSGWGHNIGMSQFGAYAMAQYFGKTYKEILGFYYTGVGLSYGRVY